jgi:DNA-binding response OmpR family regulator
MELITLTAFLDVCAKALAVIPGLQAIWPSLSRSTRSRARDPITPDWLIANSRILIIDDEIPMVAEDLRAMGFRIDHRSDLDSQGSQLVESGDFDLVLLDFGGVGIRYGQDEGLSALVHIKRINPSVIVVAYTSKALTARHSDFYVLADHTLAKDAGINETRERIIEGLQKAFDATHQWKSMLAKTGVVAESPKDRAWRKMLDSSSRSAAASKQFRSSVLSKATSAPMKSMLSKTVNRLLDLHSGTL